MATHWISILLVWFTLFGRILPLTNIAQSASGGVAVLDRTGNAVTRLVDGDQVSLRLGLVSTVQTETMVKFRLDDPEVEVAACTIPAGQASCQSMPFDSFGWYWGNGKLAKPSRAVWAFIQGKEVGRSNDLEILPRPVVLVHGLNADYHTWDNYLGEKGYLAKAGLKGFAIGDGQVPGVLNTGSIARPTERTNSIPLNAAIQGEYIEAVRRLTGAQMVDLVVHSMGGMISRYYIDRVMGERSVAQLVMLGSPMGGSDCSALAASLGFLLPATFEIRSSYMQGIFNHQITHRKGIEFFNLAGTAIREPFASPCTTVPSDLVVSEDSVNAIPLVSKQLPFLHINLNTSEEVFQQFVLPLLQRPAGSFQEAEDPAPPETPQEPLQFSRIYTGQVAAGGNQELTIPIETGVTLASFALFDPSRSLSVRVRGAAGNEISLDAQRNGLVIVDDPATMVYMGYGFQNPRPGTWRVTLIATNKTPASGTDFAISVSLTGSARLSARISNLAPMPGEEVIISAALELGGQPLAIQQAEGRVRMPDGQVKNIDLGAGGEVSASWRPEIPGLHAIDVVVTGEKPGKETVERTAFLAVDVQPVADKFQIDVNLALIIVGMLAGIGLVVSLLIMGVKWIRGSKS